MKEAHTHVGSMVSLAFLAIFMTLSADAQQPGSGAAAKSTANSLQEITLPQYPPTRCPDLI